MRYPGRLTAAFILSFALHLAVLVYMHKKPFEAFGYGGAREMPKYLQVRMVRDTPRLAAAPSMDMDRLLREKQLRQALQVQAEQPLEPIPEPDSVSESPETEVEPPKEDPLEIPALDRTSPETPEDDPFDLEVIQIPIPRVEAPIPESRVWIPEQPKGLPPAPVVDLPSNLPDPVPFSETRTKPSSVAELPSAPDLDAYPPLPPGTLSLPPDMIAPIAKEQDFDTAVFSDEREPVANWDDFLEVDIDTYRPEGEEGYFRITVRPNENAGVLRAMYKDVLFAIDASGSMENRVFGRLKEAVADSLSTLRKGDRFNIIGFKADAIALNSGLWPVRPETIAEGREFVLSLESSGKTDIYRLLSNVVESLPPGDRPFTIVLFSDGRPTVGIQDSRELINSVTLKNNLRAGIHVFGVGKTADTYLLELLAYRNKGVVRFVTDPDQLADKCRQLFEELAEPMLMDITVDLSGFPGKEAHPRVLPDLFRGGSIRIYGRFDREEEVILRLAGNARGSLKDFVYRADLTTEKGKHPDVKREWASAKAYDLIAENCAKGDSPQRIAAIRELVRSHDLRIPH